MNWFNAREEKAELNDFSPLPVGEYTMVVDEIATKTDKNSDEYISTMFLVSDGPLKGRKFFESIYIQNNNAPGLAEKGRAILKKLCEAARVESLGGPSDLAKLVGLEVEIKLGIYENKNTGKQRNVINGIRKHVKKEVVDVPW